MRQLITIFVFTASLNLSSCIVPLPVKSVSEPAVRGTVKENGVPIANIQIWLDHDGYDACNQPKNKTVTDLKGHFSFSGKNRSWSWIGWANNHFISVCVIGPDGPREGSIATYNDPKAIIFDCDLTIEDPATWCTTSCEGDGNWGC